MTLGIVAGTIIVVGVVLLVLRPLLAAQQARQRLAMDADEQQLETLLFQRETAVQAIRDLQMDHQMGKLGDADFADLDGRYRAQAVDILRQLDALGVVTAEDEGEAALDRWIEQSVADVRSGARARQGRVAAEIEHGTA